MEVRFRAYQPQDRETCRQIIQSQVGAYLAAGEAHDFEEFLAGLETKDQTGYFCVAAVGDRIIGCGGFTVNGEAATLNWGILRAGELSKGFGRALLAHRIEWLKANHPEVKSVFCDTAPQTEGFFAKRGFVTYHRQPHYWGGVLDLVAMELSLDGTARGADRKRSFERGSAAT